MKSAHVIVFPFPIQGHINPMLQFSKRLASKGLKVTLITTSTLSKSLPLHPQVGPIQIRSIYDGLKEGENVNDHEAYLKIFERVMPESLTNLINEYKNTTSPIKFIVYDCVIPWVLDLAQAAGLDGAPFFTQSAAVHYIHYHVYNGGLSSHIKGSLVSVPSLSLLKADEMPSLLVNYACYPALNALNINQSSGFDNAKMLFFNTFHNLEEQMSDPDERRNRLHASARSRLKGVAGSVSNMPKENETNEKSPDYYDGEYQQYQRDFEQQQQQEQNYNEGPFVMEDEDYDEEEGHDEEEGNEDGGNVEVTSGLRVRRGPKGRWEVYGEGSSTSVPEPRRKIRARGKDTSWIVSGPVPGGPLIPDVIPSFGGHIAHLLWGQPQHERMLTKYTRDRSFTELRRWNVSEAVGQILEESGLIHLPTIMQKNINMPLICAFIERWQPDTNTFHFPWGEMTILLHDVAEILGIAIDGMPCNISETDRAHPILGLSELLGMTEAELAEPWGPDKDARIYKGNLILNKALKELVQGEERGVRAEAQGYLMILLGSTLFVDKSSDRVRANTFPMLRNVSGVSDYAWGAGTLAYLYRQLGIATRSDCKGMCGCLTLLQSWIYEHFPAFRPTGMLAATPGSPRAVIWPTSGVRKAEAHRALLSYREQLDLMPIESVCWRPYPDPPEVQHPRSVYHGLFRFIDIVEPYHPDRCLRQFGYMQIIPIAMTPPDKSYRPTKSIAYDVQYAGNVMDYTWSNLSMHKVHLDRVSIPAFPPHAFANGYMEWFTSHSHPQVMNVPRDNIPVARSHFPATVGQSIINRFSQYDNLGDPTIPVVFQEWLGTVHPQMREYTGRPPIPRGTRGRGRHSSRSAFSARQRQGDDEGGSGGSGFD